MRIAFNPSTVAALIAPPNNKDITFDLRGRNIFARGVKFCGTDTNTWRDIKINNVSIDSNILDLRDGDNTTLTNIDGVVTINSTWRPVVDNLTSDSTTSSLSANQGRILKALIDGKSDSDHNHDDRYLRLTGGWMSGDINFGGDNKIYWGRNSGSASISFKNDGDGDADSYMNFVTSDNGNEYFRWSHSSGSTNTEWMALRSDGLRVGGTKVSLEGHSHDDRYVKKSGDTMLGALNFANGTWNKVGDDVYMGDHNIGGQLCIMGANGITGLSFHKYGDASIRKSITFDGNTLYMNGSCDYATLSNQTNLLAINTVPNKTTATSIGSWSPISGRYVFHQKWTDTSTGGDSADFGIYLDGNLTANMVLDGYYNSLLGFRVIGASGGFLKANGTIDNSTYLTSHQSLSNYYTKSEVDTKLNSKLNYRLFWERTNIDLNSITEAWHTYEVNNGTGTANTPTNASWHQAVQWGTGDTDYAVQLCTAYTSNYSLYLRHKIAGKWYNWIQLAATTDIPSSLKNPHALTISLNGTSQGPYDGSAAKNINITPSSIGAATSDHNHDSSYVKYGKVVKSTTDNANVTPYLYNVENEEVISGYYKYWYIFNMGQYSGGNFGTQIAMPYQDSLVDSELFIRSANNGSWRTWRRILHSNNYASILDSRYYTKSEINTKLGAYLPLTGGTMTGNLSFSNSGTGFRGINYGTMGDNDQWRIGGAATGSNGGYMEIATADDGNEPIYVRQYTGVFSSVVRTLTLLDANGYTHFPSYINIGGNENNNSSPDRVWGSNGSDSYLRSYRTSALNVANADKVDGYHENSFLRYRETTKTDQEATLWSQIGIKEYYGALPDSLTNVYNWGSVISLPGTRSRFEIYASHWSSNGDGLYYRSGWNSDKKTWLKFIDSSNIGSQTVASATKLQTARKIWGQSFDGTADVNGTIYINNSDSSNGAIRLNNNVNSNARISAISDQIIFNTGSAIRFGETSWDWNQWAGLKYTHSNKTIYLGIADGSIFNSNSAQSGGILNLRAGISNINLNSGTSIRGLPTNGSPYYSRVTLYDTSISLAAYGDISMSTEPGAIKLSSGYGGVKLSCQGANASISSDIKVEASKGVYLNSGNSGNVYLCQGGGNVGIGTTTPAYKLDINGQMRASGFIHSDHSINDAVLLAGGGYGCIFTMSTARYHNSTSYELFFHKLSGLCNNLVWVDGSIWSSTSTSFQVSSDYYPYIFANSPSMRTIYRIDKNNIITIDGYGQVVISCPSYPRRIGFFYTGRD